MKIRKNYLVTSILLLLFFLLTWMVTNVDVKPIGPEGSVIGLSTLNRQVGYSSYFDCIWICNLRTCTGDSKKKSVARG